MLDDRQKDMVRQWAAEGAGLSEIQRRIKEDFGISMTYMDVRFLMLDLHADVKDKPEPKEQGTGNGERGTGNRERGTGNRERGTDTPGLDTDDGEDETEDNRQTDKPTNRQTTEGTEDGDGYTPPDMEGGNVTVELDRVVRAGAIASGSVTFSDGVTGSWYLDQMGRLGITKVSKPGYQPSREDIESFQMALQEKLAGGAY